MSDLPASFSRHLGSDPRRLRGTGHRRRPQCPAGAHACPVRCGCRLPGDDSAVDRLRRDQRRHAVRRTARPGSSASTSTTTSASTASRCSSSCSTASSPSSSCCRLEGDREQGRPVQRRLPDHVRADERHLRLARRHAVLRLLRSHADPAVPDHRRLGRSATASMRRSSSSSTRCSVRCSSCWR